MRPKQWGCMAHNQNIENDLHLISVSEAAAILNEEITHALNLIKWSTFQAVKRGGMWLLERSAIEAEKQRRDKC